MHPSKVNKLRGYSGNIVTEYRVLLILFQSLLLYLYLRSLLFSFSFTFNLSEIKHALPLPTPHSHPHTLEMKSVLLQLCLSLIPIPVLRVHYLSTATPVITNVFCRQVCFQALHSISLVQFSLYASAPQYFNQFALIFGGVSTLIHCLFFPSYSFLIKKKFLSHSFYFTFPKLVCCFCSLPCKFCGKNVQIALNLQTNSERIAIFTIMSLSIYELSKTFHLLSFAFNKNFIISFIVDLYIF